MKIHIATTLEASAEDVIAAVEHHLGGRYGTQSAREAVQTLGAGTLETWFSDLLSEAHAHSNSKFIGDENDLTIERGEEGR